MYRPTFKQTLEFFSLELRLGKRDRRPNQSFLVYHPTFILSLFELDIAYLMQPLHKRHTKMSRRMLQD